jgi:hypothetical protein
LFQPRNLLAHGNPPALKPSVVSPHILQLMKVFISHSSSDKWIARQIAEHLQARDIDSFLDEKDIETGDGIDEAIQKHLAECDELLMLLSPAALDSAWVLMEIGGAKALGKRLVPILVHVGANDLPDPLSTGLARDLNEIENYYGEVQKRAGQQGAPKGGKPPAAAGDGTAEDSAPVKRKKGAKGTGARRALEQEKRPARGVTRAPKTFETGERVRLPAVRPKMTYTRDGRDVGWSESMDQYLGRLAKITKTAAEGWVRVDIDDEAWVWLMDWLEAVPPEQAE